MRNESANFVITTVMCQEYSYSITYDNSKVVRRVTLFHYAEARKNFFFLPNYSFYICEMYDLYASLSDWEILRIYDVYFWLRKLILKYCAPYAYCAAHCFFSFFQIQSEIKEDYILKIHRKLPLLITFLRKIFHLK